MLRLVMVVGTVAALALTSVAARADHDRELRYVLGGALIGAAIGELAYSGHYHPRHAHYYGHPPDRHYHYVYAPRYYPRARHLHYVSGHYRDKRHHGHRRHRHHSPYRH